MGNNTLVLRILDADGKAVFDEGDEGVRVYSQHTRKHDPVKKGPTLFACMELYLTKGITTEVMGIFNNTKYTHHRQKAIEAVKRAQAQLRGE